MQKQRTDKTARKEKKVAQKSAFRAPTSTQLEQATTAFALDEKTLSLYRLLPEDGSTCLPDELAQDFDTRELLQALTMLEMARLIIRFPSGRVCRATADTVGLVHS